MKNTDATEGVIKFSLTLNAGSIPETDYRELDRWRTILFEHKLIGQDPDRYDGLGYGNISKRIDNNTNEPGHRAFLICGSQTGGKAQLEQSDYCVVEQYDVLKHSAVATGSIKPSSESLTHAVLYDLDDYTRAVAHVHSPELWEHADRYGLFVTPVEYAYGTAELVTAIQNAWQEGLLTKGVFSMGGHQDGIVSFGKDLEQACTRLLQYWIRATE